MSVGRSERTRHSEPRSTRRRHGKYEPVMQIRRKSDENRHPTIVNEPGRGTARDVVLVDVAYVR
jgi:hypothetical protein